MGNANSGLLNVCHTLKKKKDGTQEPGDDDSTITDSAIVLRNKDKYFSKEDYDKIMEKYPLFKQWIDESTNAQTKDRPKLKKIRFREAEVIGLGSYGRVIMGLNAENGCLMATKQVQLGTGNHPAQQEKIRSLQMEIDLLSRFSHKNIVRYYGAQQNKNTFNIFLEYVSGGSIASLLDKYGPFNENLIRVYIRQILEGLEYLHVRNTIHRDIKGANILVDNSGICKLADFGTATKISRLVEIDSKDISSIKGTVRWMAPEVIKQNSLGRFCDIWSVGCTVIEMATAKPPWYNVVKANSNSISTLYQIAQAKSPPPLPKGLSAEAIDFLKLCFKTNPRERPNVIKLLQHKFVSGMESPYQSFEYPSRDSQSSQSAGARFTVKTIQNKRVGQTDLNQNQNLASKTVKRQLSGTTSLKINQEIQGKEKQLEVLSEIKPLPAPIEKMIIIENQSERTSDNQPNIIPKIKRMSNPITPNNKLYLVQGGEDYRSQGEDLKETVQYSLRVDNTSQMSDDNNAVAGVDLRRNQKVTIVPKQHEQPASKHEHHFPKMNQLADINCFVEGESGEEGTSDNERETYIPNPPKKRTTYITHDYRGQVQLSTSNEDANQQIGRSGERFEEKKVPRRGFENKKPVQLRLNIEKVEEKADEMSQSQDSDRESSVVNNSMSKPFGNAYGIDNNSYSVHNFEGRNMKTNLHDQSSRLSFRRDVSFDTKVDQVNFEGSSQFQDQKGRKPRTKSEVLRLESGTLGRRNDEKQMGGMASSLNKKEETRKSNWSLMIPESEEEFGKKRFNKIQEKEEISRKESDNEYLQNFNLLDDLNKVYGQLDSINPPINS